MRHTTLLSRIIIVFMVCFFSISHIKAFDYYVSPTGNGSGTEDSPASFTSLVALLNSTITRTYLNNLEEGDTDVNIYFMGGTYTATNTVISFGTSASIAGLTYNFQSYDENEVVIQRSSASNNFMTLTSGNTTNGDVDINFSNITFGNMTFTGNTNYMFAGASNTNLTFTNVKFRSNTVARYMIYTTATTYTMLFKNVTFENNSPGRALFYSSGSTTSTDVGTIFEDCNFIGNTTTYHGLLEFDGTGAGTYNEFRNCIFTNNRVNVTTADYSLIYSSGSNLSVSGSTFNSNTFDSPANNRIIYTTTTSGRTCLIYNNTFSDNSLTTAINNTISRNGGIFNNTFYNSGNINLGAAIPVRNNLLIGGSITGSTNNNVARNIFNNGFYASGLTNPTDTRTYSDYVEALAEYETGKPSVHALKIISGETNPILQKGGNPTDVGEYGSLVFYDQRGKRRPDDIALGSWDLPVFGAIDGSYSILYNPEEGLAPYYEIDLSNYIMNFPEGADVDNITYSVLTQPSNGEITPLNNRKVRFIPRTNEDGEPASGIVGVSFNMTYQVFYQSGGIEYVAKITLKITITNVLQPLGIIDDSIVKCYREMGNVSFAPAWKFQTRTLKSNQRYDGFSIPLVGDLNGDGKPEIVALGISSTSTGSALGADASHICIVDGQTGELLVRFPLESEFSIRSGYHNTPCHIALVDADRNGLAEIIVAYGHGSGNFQKRLASYEVNENTFLPASELSIESSSRLTRKWLSDTRYDAYSGGFYTSSTNNNVNMPLPQIVDIDGDGEAEIVVYNKIYSALTGKLLLTFEDLGPSSNQYSGRLNSYSQYEDYAFIGRNRKTSTSNDTNLNFLSVYDLDHDGVYEIIAGGKVYYDLNLETGEYKVLKAKNISDELSSMTVSIGDGYTGVADINGDGKAEVVVVAYEGSNGSPMAIHTWDPGLLVKDTDGSWRKLRDNEQPQPKLLSYTQVPFTYQTRQGTLSYVYIGDIDGKVQTVNGKSLKLPEISVLGPRFYNNSSMPMHPNVQRDYGYPANYSHSYNSTSIRGALMSWTWDEEATAVNQRLKVSFMLEHNDRSINTGFTLFDFDNDGVQEICYRDEQTLRIIGAVKPVVTLNDTEATKFSERIRSFTGFEYPVIADIDGDSSADMIVMGSPNNDDARGYIYAVESENGDFAPAPKVWNQFMYHPLKINEDLTTPLINLHPLSDDLSYVKEQDKATGVKTHVYNNTITQAVVSSVFDGVLKPIVRTPDAVVDGKIDTGTGNNDGKMIITIKNTGDATLNARTPIRFYKDAVGTAGFLTTLAGNPLPTTIGKDIFTGDSIVITHPLTAAEMYESYVIRVTDASTSTNVVENIAAQEGYYDCNWADNVIEIGMFVARDDAATVMQYGQVVIDLFANDEIPDDYTGGLNESMITVISNGQTNIGTWKISGTNFIYTAPNNYQDGGVVEFQYTLTHVFGGVTYVKTASIFIYIMENCSSGFTICENTDYQFCLNENPQGVIFQWYEGMNDDILLSGAPLIQNAQSGRTYTYAVKPDFSSVTDAQYSRYKLVNFPRGEVSITVLPGNSADFYTLKWTGLVDKDWYNPENWVLLEDGIQKPTTWTPSACMNVIISSGVSNYPELTRSAACAHIKMENRAMLAGIHFLQYETAEIELTLEATERDRFVMWSAPMRKVYTGDYHFEKNNQPYWGDVYMNFFQADNPDGGSAIDEAFTATFGSVKEELSLGRAFNIKVENTNLSTPFTFPQTHATYTDDKTNQPVSVPRSQESNYFIVDYRNLDANGEIEMPVYESESSLMIQVVNPFMAYLDAGKFLSENTGKIQQSYKIWNGDLNSGFIDVKYEDEGQRYYIDQDGWASLTGHTDGLIAPLQSFFVLKKSEAKIQTLKMSAAWTTTGTADYDLRNSQLEQHILRIKATSEEGTNMTVLYYDENAISGYRGEEDSRKLFNPESTLEIYSFAGTKEPLAFNANGDYTSQNVRLGIKMKQAGKLNLDFTGMERFRHDVFLVDHDNDEKVYDLSVNPSLTFDIDGYSTGDGIDLPNRFSLMFIYTGIDKSNEEVVDNDVLKVVSQNGHLLITADGQIIENLQIYNVNGQRIYQSRKGEVQFRVPVASNQFYIVKGQINYKLKIVKTISK